MKKHLNIKSAYVRDGASWGPVSITLDYDPDGTGIEIKGLSPAAVKQTMLRTEAAMRKCGYMMPAGRFSFNLSPHNIGPHESTSFYDLPIALGMLSASGRESLAGLNEKSVWGRFAVADDTLVQTRSDSHSHGDTLRQVVASFRRRKPEKTAAEDPSAPTLF